MVFAEACARKPIMTLYRRWHLLGAAAAFLFIAAIVIGAL